jgi:predicted HAD superfamily Cof-like phosphohydrolase
MDTPDRKFVGSADIIENTFGWFVEARPEPNRKDFNVQLGVHVEEFGEMLDELTPQDRSTAQLVDDANRAVKALAKHLKGSTNAVVVKEENRIGFLDSLCDQLVTATGTGQAQAMNVPGGLNEVNVSNYSKFVDGKAIFDENGKVAKGPGYVKADLSPFV